MMSQIKQIIEITPPTKLFGAKEQHSVVFSRCAYCNGRGGFCADAYSFKFENDLKEKYKPCDYCKGTGQIEAIVSIEFVPYGEIKEEYKPLEDGKG